MASLQCKEGCVQRPCGCAKNRKCKWCWCVRLTANFQQCAGTGLYWRREGELLGAVCCLSMIMQQLEGRTGGSCFAGSSAPVKLALVVPAAGPA